MASNRHRADLPSAFQTEIKAMIAGFINSLPSSVTSLNVNGTSMTPAQIQSQLDAIALTLSTVDVNKTAYFEALATRKAALPGDKTFYAGLVAALRGLFGATSGSQLKEFTPHARLSTDQKAIAKAKSLATRALRGTMAASGGKRSPWKGSPPSRCSGRVGSR